MQAERDAVSEFLRELAHSPSRDPEAARRETLRPGDVVARFELLREVGRGGFGVVFEARDREGRRVALKTVRPGEHAEAGREMLVREASASGPRHPNVVEVLGSGSSERGPWVALEYLSGETLEARLRRGPLPVPEAIAVALAVARALAHVHAHGVVHRDVKPGNVYLPFGCEAKLIDFGLASRGAGAPRGSGTSGYMAPEQRRGGREDARSDLFALGLLIHEMARGKALLRPDRRGEAGAPPSSPSPGGMPPELERLVAELVEEDPARRPGSAEEVLARLRAIRRRLSRTAPRGRRAVPTAWGHAPKRSAAVAG